MSRTFAQAKERQEYLRNLLLRERNVSTTDLANQFDVSVMTIRRDLKELQNSGLAMPCYGGALATKRISFEFEFDERHRTHFDEKERIGRKAAERINDDQVVFLDTGTTTLEIAKTLRQIGVRCTVITGSLVVASELWTSENIELHLLGGQVRRNNPDLVGPYSEAMMDRLTADIAFLGCDGLDPNRGSFANDLNIARIAERMAKNSQYTIIVADSSKLGKSGMGRYVTIQEIDELITNKKADPSGVKKLRSKGIRVALV